MNLRLKLFYAITGFLVGNLVLALFGCAIYYLTNQTPSDPQISFDQAVVLLQGGQVTEIKFVGTSVEFEKDGGRSVLINPTEEQRETLFRTLSDLKATQPKLVVEPSRSGLWLLVLIQAVPVLIVFGLSTIIILLILILLRIRSTSPIR